MRKMLWGGTSIVLVAAAAGLSGCFASAPSQPPEPAEVDRPFTETVVELKADGTQEVYVNHLTADEAAARADARDAAKSTQHSNGGEIVGTTSQADTTTHACDGTEGVFIKDQVCTQLTANSICFINKSSNPPGVNLGSYIWKWIGGVPFFWSAAGAVQSYTGVKEDGYITSYSGGGSCGSGCTVNFTANGTCNNWDASSFGLPRYVDLTD